jgi:hypothetical protein
MYSFQKSPTSHKILWLTRSDHIAQGLLIFIPLWFAIILFNKYNTFETSTVYYYMLRQMTELHWAAFSFIVSILSIFCWATGNKYIMIFQNSILMMWHGLVAICLFLGNPFTPGSGTFAALAFACMLRAINLSLSNQIDWR